jgi:hypothetical protein
MKMWIILGVLIVIGALSWGVKELHEEVVEARVALQSQAQTLAELDEGVTKMYELSKSYQDGQTKRQRALELNMNEVLKYAKDTSIPRVKLNGQWVWLYDLQTLGLEPESAAARDLRAITRESDDIEILETHTVNSNNYRQVASQLQLCKAYVKSLDSAGRF